MIDLSGLPASAVDSWKRDDVTEHLVRQLQAMHQAWLTRLENAASAGSEAEVVHAHGGRCAALRDVIQSIRTAKGSPTE